MKVKIVSTARSSSQHQKCPALGILGVFMLTHGNEVRKVSFLLVVLEALSVVAFRRVGKVSSSVRFGYFLTLIDVKYSIY